MPELDPEVVSAMQKLTRKSFPVKLHLRPQTLARARADLDALVQAKAGSGLKEKVKALLMPAHQLEAQIKRAQELVAILDADQIDGTLSPLSEQEVWAVRAHFTHISLYLKRQLLQPGESTEKKAANKAADDAIDIIANQVWMSKWVGFSLRRNDGALYWPNAETPPDLEPEVLAKLFNMYGEAFKPTESELKKYVASRISRN